MFDSFLGLSWMNGGEKEVDPATTDTTSESCRQLGEENQKLTIQLVHTKHEWEIAQRTLRANAHARFLYQTTLARIVSYVQDLETTTDEDDDDNDNVDNNNDHDGSGSGSGHHPKHHHPTLSPMVHDIVRWFHECEHIAMAAADENDAEPTTDGGKRQEKKDDNDDNDDDGRSSRLLTITRHGLPLDYGDVIQPIASADVDGPSTPHQLSIINNNRKLPASLPAEGDDKSLREQNLTLRREIVNWTDSMARIWVENQREVQELLAHQVTLRRVIERIQQQVAAGETMTVQSSQSSTSQSSPKASKVFRVDDVIRWYEECQREAAKCGSISEKDATEDFPAGRGDSASDDIAGQQGNGEGTGQWFTGSGTDGTTTPSTTPTPTPNNNSSSSMWDEVERHSAQPTYGICDPSTKHHPHNHSPAHNNNGGGNANPLHGQNMNTNTKGKATRPCTGCTIM